MTWQEKVQCTYRYSCGCTTRKSEPQQMINANAWPGAVTICDKHDEWVVVTRASTYLHDQHAAMVRLLIGAGLDADQAEIIAAEAD